MSTGTMHDDPLPDALPHEPATEQPGDDVGPYRLLDKIGEGGFGDVWRAEQTRPVQREVALKMIKPGMNSREVLGRFEQERQVLGGMEHPHIAAMLDAGMAPDGRPYFVMELVKGVPVTRYCIEKQLPLRERISLFKDVCMGVQHAHQKGVIHRDLKPTNILVTEVDGMPVPKIIDFGIAKAMTTQRIAGLTQVTLPGTLIGTPLYMSPEQIDDVADVDTRSDIYALGVLLYELLAGRPPFDVVTLTSNGQSEMRRIIREVTPLPPSRRVNDERQRRARQDASLLMPARLPATVLDELSTDQKSAATGPQPLRRPAAPAVVKLTAISGDLDWITLCALEKEPGRRYPAAADFAADLQRYLDNEPVLAHPPSASYIAARWIKRHRAAFAAACVSTLALIGGTAVALWQAAEARREKNIAEDLAARSTAAEALAMAESSRAQRTAAFLTTLLDHAADEIGHGRNPEALKLALEHSGEKLSELGNDPVLHGQLLDRLSGLYSAIGEWKSALELMRARIDVLVRLHGAESGEAREAELAYLKIVADHGARATAPAQLETLRTRIEKGGERGGKFWFQVQRELVRVWMKLDDGQAALAASTELLTEAEQQKLTGKSLISARLTHAAVLEFVHDFDAAEALLSVCREMAAKKRDDAIQLKQIDDRLLAIMVSRGDHAKAAAFLREKLARAKTTSIEASADPRAVILLLNQLTIQETAADEHAAAITHGKEALDIARSIPITAEGDSGRAAVGESLRRLAECESAANHHGDAIRHAEEARANAVKQGGTAALLVALRCQGEVLHAAGRLDDAYRCFEERDQVQQNESANYRSRAEALEDMLLIRLEQGRPDDALALGQKMWSHMMEAKTSRSDTGHLGYVAAFAVKAWGAVKSALPDAAPPADLAKWQSAVEAAQRLQKDRKNKSR